MNSLIFDVMVRLLKPAIYAVALWLFLRGHGAPGGGFIAGLIAASAVVLQILSQGWKSLSPRLTKSLFPLMGVGLLVSVLSGLFAMAIQNPFMTGRWGTIFGMMLGTPMLFDLGVFIVVFCVVVICSGYLLKEEDEAL
jgi:multisubunit Na+/H+ antiporter MnhB subunit